MSLSAAVHVATMGQLVADGRPLPTTMKEVMGKEYKYDVTTIRNFLMGVSQRLKADIPSLNFRWTTLDSDTCLKDNVAALEGYIASATG